MTVNRLTIMDGVATGIADGDSGIVRVGPRDNQRDATDALIPITFTTSYTSGAGTCTPYKCVDPDTSPRVWVPIQKLQDDGTDVAVTRTADFIMTIDLPSGTLVKWTISSGSSPVIVMVAEGWAHGSV